MTNRSCHGADNQAIADLPAARRRARRERDAAAIGAPLAPDAPICNLASPLANRGRDAAGVVAWLASRGGPVDPNDHDTRISGDGTVTFAAGPKVKP